MRQWIWLLSFCAVASVIFLPVIKGKKEALHILHQRLASMRELKLQELEKRQQLELCIASQNDPAWIEMVLMRDLGVVPEGFLKVHFQK